MITIYKYPVPILDSFELALPIHSRILAFQIKDETPFIWALVDTCNDIETRTFSIYGTGKPIESKTIYHDKYIGTVQKKFGFVWHLFEVLNGGKNV